MFLSRTVLIVTKLFRSISIPRRRSLMIGMAILLLFSFMVGANVLARKNTVDGNLPVQSTTQKTLQTAFPASYSHVVTRVGAAAPADVASNLVTTVPSASFETVPVAPGSIVSAFGSKIAGEVAVIAPPGAILPTELGGTTVEVNGRKAGLFFVSENQINYYLPDQTEVGSPANVVVKYGAKISTGTVMVAQVSPAIFTANATGGGVPAANILRISANGQVRYEELKQYSELAQGFIPKPIDMGPSTDQVFLILYLSGIRQAADDDRNGNSNESVRVLMGGLELGPSSGLTFAGAVPGFVGLDQVNVRIPRNDSLRGRSINVSVSGQGITSNSVTIEIAGTSGSQTVQVAGFSGPALAGTSLLINGSGFSPVKTENIVTIGSSPAEVMNATTTQLEVMVPVGVQSSAITVKTLQGEGRSVTVLPVRTSVSGIVESSNQGPLKGVTVSVFGESNKKTTTNDDGLFILADVPTGLQTIEIDGGTVATTPVFPRQTRIVRVLTSRDNQTSTIYLTQPTGGSAVIGGESLAVRNSANQQTEPDQQAVTIKTGDFELQIPSGIKVTTPDGKNTATVVLTPLENGRTPVALPYGYYSSSIVQITPFDIKLDPGAKLVFPNKDDYPAGTQLVLFRYDPAADRFVQEKATVSVSADGRRIETDTDDIKVTSYYFASIFRNTTTITGRVFENDQKTPVLRALARYRGQEAYTDGTGTYVLRYVTVDEKDISIEISTPRSSTRVDRVVTQSAQVALSGITKMPDVYLPDIKENRPPTIVALQKVAVAEGQEQRVGIQITDPDRDTISSVTVSGAPFATVIPPSPLGVTAGYVLRLAPDSTQAGNYTVTITATDSRGARAILSIAVVVNDTNQTPTATSQSVTLDEDTAITIKLAGSDPDRDSLTFKTISKPSSGVLSGDLPTLTYKPNLNFNGTDRFTFVVNDGKVDSREATVSITVRPINDPPGLTVPAAQTISEGQLLTFPVSAFDPDTGQNLTITASGLPEGATFTPISPTSAQFRWMPSFTQAGSYPLSFKAEDNGTPKLGETKEVRITVTDVTMLVVPNSLTVNEGQTVSFDVFAASGLPSAATITLLGKPDGAEFPDAASNTGKFRWTPGTAQAGSYNLTFKATINSPVPVSEMKIVQITVLDVVRDLNQESASYSIFGAAGPLPFTLGDDGDGLGTSLATGDLNGDDVADLAVGAPAANGVGLNNGKVYIFFGRANQTGSVDLARDKADVEILGETQEDRFGSSLAIGDLNGDGKNDLAIGAPMANAGTNLNAGKVYVIFSGFTAGASDSITRVAGATIFGNQRSERIGASLAIAPLTPKSASVSDLIIGGPGFDSASGAASLIDAGAVFVFFGGTALTKTVEQSSAAAGYTVTGTLAGGQIGTTLAVGNFNGDNLSDVAIGAPLANANGVKGSGIVYLALGSDGLGGTKNTSQASSMIFFGGGEDSNLGISLAMGDLNGDERADLVLGAAGASAPGDSRPKVGAVYVVYGAATLQNRSPDLTVYGIGANGDEFPDALGKTLAIGDFNGDGIADLAIGAPGADSADSKRDPTGAVYSIFGARTGLTGIYDLATKAADWTALGADSGDNLGGAAIAIANINASEPADMILGIPKGKSVNNSRVDAGEVRIVHGVRR